MITRPKGLKSIEVEIYFNFQNFTQLEIDLAHINKSGRSIYTARDISKILVHMLNGLSLSPSDERSFGEEMCVYFVRTAAYEGKRYKTVFCICSDMPGAIGVITLHRV